MQSTDYHQRKRPVPRTRYGIATVFALGGIIVCSTLAVMSWLVCSFAGWGDGATGNAIGSPVLAATFMVLPLVIYFSAGVTSAISIRRWIRVGAAWIAHSVLLIPLVFLTTSPHNELLSQLFGIYAIIAILFCLCWVKVFMNHPPSGTSHPTSEHDSPHRLSLVDNKRIPMTTLRILAQDPDEEVRKYALEKIAQLQHKQ